MKWVLSWDEAYAAGPTSVGGKGWNLSRLQRYGFPIPRGCVLVADAYRVLMEAVSLSDEGQLLQRLSQCPTDELAAPSSARQMMGVRDRICSVEFPPEIVNAVERGLAEHRIQDVAVAVRSSATTEDSSTASFAGVHESVLHVRGVSAVLAAVKRCASSLWTPQALSYRRQAGFDEDEVACAVVLCEMIGNEENLPTAAGVAFSCDPRSGRRDCVVVDAVAGWGEDLVSGQVTAQGFCVELRDARLRVVRRELTGQPLLSDEELRQLARLVWRVHWALGDGHHPQDVEWVWKGKQFTVVQARPVTHVPHVTFPAVADLPVIWSNSNLAEVLPGVPTTLTWSFVQGMLRDILHEGLIAAGYEIPRLDTCRRFHGRLYFDLTSLQWANYDCYGLTPSDVNRTLGGHQPEIPVPDGNPYFSRRGWNWMRRRVKFLLALRRAAKTLPETMRTYRKQVDQWNETDLTTCDLGGLARLLKESVTANADFFHQFMLASMLSGVWHTLLEGALRKVAPDRSMSIANGLVAGAGDVVTAEVGYRLFDLARVAAAEPEAVAYLKARDPDPQGWLELPTDSSFRAGMKELLDECGHRAVYETEFANPRWGEDPSYLLEGIKHFLGQDGVASPREVARARRTAAERELRQVTRARRPAIHWLAEQATHGAAMRERGRSTGVYGTTFLRSLATEIGRRMVVQGCLAREEDVFHLSWCDIECFVRGEWEGTGGLAAVWDRKEQGRVWNQEDAPPFFLLDGEGRPATMPTEIRPHGNAEHDDLNAGDRVLVGISASPGRATGKCRVLRHPSEGVTLLAGEVLVAHATDPSWTPLFLRTAAVVTQVGGHLSHAAIVAREYGLPAVINVPNLLETVSTGDELIVDGDTGEVAWTKTDNG